MSTTISRRRSIVEALLTRLATIAVAGGYRTDGGAHLYAGWMPELSGDADVGDPDAALALVVGDDTAKSVGGKNIITLPIEIHCLARGTRAEAWLSVEDLLADVKEVIEAEDWSLDGLANDRIDRGVTRTREREPGSTMVGAAIEYTLTYAETWGAP